MPGHGIVEDFHKGNDSSGHKSESGAGPMDADSLSPKTAYEEARETTVYSQVAPRNGRSM